MYFWRIAEADSFEVIEKLWPHFNRKRRELIGLAGREGTKRQLENLAAAVKANPLLNLDPRTAKYRGLILEAITSTWR